MNGRLILFCHYGIVGTASRQLRIDNLLAERTAEAASAFQEQRLPYIVEQPKSE